MLNASRPDTVRTSVDAQTYLRDIETLATRSVGISPPEEIIDESRNGRMFILVDDEDRENEGDLIIPADVATPDAINFMAKHGRGLICLAMTKARIDQLAIPMMSRQFGARHETAFTVSIEAREGVTTGISAADRARTIAVAIDPTMRADQIVTPGHVFPLVARDGGVLVRAGHTEAAVDVSRLAGRNPAGVICEILKDDGTMARLSDLIPFAAVHGLKIGTIRDLIAYRRRYDHLVECVAESQLDSVHGGIWTVKTYISRPTHSEHLVLIKGKIDPRRSTLVRMHPVSPFTDILGEKSDRTGQLQRAMEIIGDEGAGVVVMLIDNSPDRLKQFVTQRAGAQDVVEQRDYGTGAQILTDLGVRDMVLLTNSTRTYVGLGGHDLRVVDQRALA